MSEELRAARESVAATGLTAREALEQIRREAAEHAYRYLAESYGGPASERDFVESTEPIIQSAIDAATAAKDEEIAKLTAERDAARAENEALRDRLAAVEAERDGLMQRFDNLVQHGNELSAERDAAKEDAERYRLLHRAEQRKVIPLREEIAGLGIACKEAESRASAAEAERDDILEAVKRSQMEHGDCGSGKRYGGIPKACTACMAQLKLKELVAAWKGRKIRAAFAGVVPYDGVGK